MKVWLATRAPSRILGLQQTIMARMSNRDRFRFERDLWKRGVRFIAGVDEAGRGPLAGPVVAAAVQLPVDWIQDGIPSDLAGLNDSKQLLPELREHYFALLNSMPGIRHGIAIVHADIIDQINILRATHRAMNLALANLQLPLDHVLVDGLAVHSMTFPQTALVEGDARSFSIAAASVLAKVTRDRMMLDYHEQWPDYGFADHKGYGTPRHLEALQRMGPCPIHRFSFAPIRPRMQPMELF